MKVWQNGRCFGRWKAPIAIGFVLSAIGLGLGAVLLGQILPTLTEGADLPQGHSVLLVESMVAMLLTLIGFALMVIGADPFDDASGEFENETRSLE